MDKVSRDAEHPGIMHGSQSENAEFERHNSGQLGLRLVPTSHFPFAYQSSLYRPEDLGLTALVLYYFAAYL
jgi:hypothetical protein